MHASAERQPEDAELTRRAQKGDEDAVCRLVERYAEKLFATAVLLLGSRADAEDVVQETFIGMLRGLSGFRHRASLKTWLYGILFRQAARQRKTRDRLPRPLADEPGLTRQAESGAVDVKMDIHEALENLSTEHREVLVLREFEGLSYLEISQVLNLKIGTVESRLSRARGELRRRLAGYGREGTSNHGPM